MIFIRAAVNVLYARIGIGALIFLGIDILSAVSRTRRKDPS